MKRVLLLIPSMGGTGGAERMVHLLSELLAEAGAEVHQASFDPPGTRRHFEGPVPLHALGPFPRLPLALRPIVYFQAARRLRALKRTLGIDATVSNLWGGDLISALSGGCDFKVALCHSNIVGNPANALMVRLRPLVAAVYRSLDRVIAVNEALALELRALYGLNQFMAGHIDNFVSVRDAAPVIPEDGVARFVWCGRLSPEKNVEGLLHAWSAFVAERTRVQLLLVGDGPLREELRRLAVNLGLGWGGDPADAQAKLVSLGMVDEPAGYIAGARALLLTSRAEGLPMVILEALGLGVPVLAADSRPGGVRQAIAGTGTCDPCRPEAERTAAGALLPIPEGGQPATLLPWTLMLAEAYDKPASLLKWKAGAFERARLFDRDTARRKWCDVLGLHQTRT